MRLLYGVLFAAAILASLMSSPASHASDVRGLRLERVVLVYRHGVRTPLPGEIQLDEAGGAPWPKWRQPPSALTPHGAAGASLMGRYDRRRLVAEGLFGVQACPAPAQVWFWANTDQRTIASAQALAEGFAPGCRIAIGHRAPGSEDPLFHPIEAGATDWNAPDAVVSIQAETGGPDALIGPHGDALAAMARLMGCGGGHDAEWCAPTRWTGNLELSPDSRRMVLSGPIATTSGTAEAILMAYAEGRPLQEVGWGRAAPAHLEQLSQLHALLFDIYARPSYMAERVASVMSRRIAGLLQDEHAPRLSVLVGSDNNIVALASVLGLHFQLPGYAQDDPPIGGALGLELWRDPGAQRRYVRVFYQAQSLEQLRELAGPDAKHAPATLELQLEACDEAGRGLCSLEQAVTLLQRAAAHAR
jgi:4-phytase/acid phosphatase